MDTTEIKRREFMFFENLNPRLLTAATAGLRLRAFHRGRLALDVEWGQTSRYYDMASLTKIVATNTLIAAHSEKKRLDCQAPVAQYLPWFASLAGLGHERLRIADLLCHRAGLNWWYPYYEKIDTALDYSGRKLKLQELLAAEPCQTPIKSRYSDLDYLLLGMVLEAVGQKPLDQMWHEFARSVGIDCVFYHPNHRLRYARELYAPVEDRFLRHAMVQGEVHDGNCWFLGGVTGHAGLFADMDGFSQWAELLHASWLGNKIPAVFPRAATWRKFLKRATPKDEEDWAWGWMMPTPAHPSCGQYFTPDRSFGHTGFVGTSFWWDQEKDWMVLILANRLQPEHSNKAFPQLRPQLHDAAYRAVVGVNAGEKN